MRAILPTITLLIACFGCSGSQGRTSADADKKKDVCADWNTENDQQRSVRVSAILEVDAVLAGEELEKRAIPEDQVSVFRRCMEGDQQTFQAEMDQACQSGGSTAVSRLRDSRMRTCIEKAEIKAGSSQEAS